MDIGTSKTTNKLKIKSEDGKEHDEDDDKDGDIKEVKGWFLL